MVKTRFPFDPRPHLEQLLGILEEIRALPVLEDRDLHRLVRKYPKAGGGAFSKSELIRAYRFLAPRQGWDDAEAFIDRVRMKPIRTASGVAPVTVLTKPFPCPGRCIFCPNDVRMPKSYLSREPGAQRAAQYEFDPYGQTLGRLLAFYYTGHKVDKVELIILGGTWSFYPVEYQIWFVKRCFDAMNDFDTFRDDEDAVRLLPRGPLRFAELTREVDGERLARSREAGSEPEDDAEPEDDVSYNRIVSAFLKERLAGGMLDLSETAAWKELEAAHQVNETAAARCVGLVVETRPDHLSPEEVVRIRRLGCTKVQIGFQSLDDRVLRMNRRGHDVAATRRAVAMLRRAGFKLHAHWMPNLHGSSPEADVVDFDRLFADPDFRPDELKVYPCSLIESAELMGPYRRGEWRPYSEEELVGVLESCLPRVPPWCRVTRVIRDIPGDDILTGNKITNLREVVEKRLRRQGRRLRDIRAREVRGREIDPETLSLEVEEYRSSVGREIFLQFVTPEDQIVGFCRLALPDTEGEIAEIRHSAMIREVHVYGRVVSLGDQHRGRAQHLGLGTRLVEEAAQRAAESGFTDLAVISAIGTREYYRRLGFADGPLYMHRPLRREQVLQE